MLPLNLDQNDKKSTGCGIFFIVEKYEMISPKILESRGPGGGAENKVPALT